MHYYRISPFIRALLLLGMILPIGNIMILITNFSQIDSVQTNFKFGSIQQKYPAELAEPIIPDRLNTTKRYSSQSDRSFLRSDTFYL